MGTREVSHRQHGLPGGGAVGLRTRPDGMLCRFVLNALHPSSSAKRGNAQTIGAQRNAPRPTAAAPCSDPQGHRGSAFLHRRLISDRADAVVFGYTHCPDVCPTTVQDLAEARDLLAGPLRDDVTVVFVTEDPKRDTPGTLRRWLDRFDPAIVGLIGGNSASRAMLKELYLPETVRDPKPTQRVRHGNGHAHDEHGEYGVDHSGVVYAFAPQGWTVSYTGGTTAPQYAADFTRLLTTTR
jgi:protein SCO1